MPSLRRAAALIVALLALTAFAATPVRAAGLVYVTGPAGQLTNFTVPLWAHPAGSTVTFVNLDAASHDVVAECISVTPCTLNSPGAYGSDEPYWCNPGPGQTQDPYPAGKCPLFWSPLVGLSGVTPVHNIDLIQPGLVYRFRCSIHANMQGTLVALPGV